MDSAGSLMWMWVTFAYLIPAVMIAMRTLSGQTHCAQLRHSLMTAYLELTKPRITLFIVMSTAIGFLCVRDLAGMWTLFHALLGTALMASGTAALNQWYEHDADAKMNRTKWRPIPSGRVTVRHVFWFGVVLSLGGFADLWLGTNRLAAAGCVANRFYKPLRNDRRILKSP